MSLVTDPHHEDARVVAAEVVAHLREIDSLDITDARALATAWMQVHQCDSAILDSLDATRREHYQAIVHGRRNRSPRPSRWSDRTEVRTGVAHLRVAVHRRLIVLVPVARPSAVGLT